MPRVGQFTQSQWLLGTRQQSLQGFMRHGVDFLVGHPRLQRNGDQMLVPPSCSFNNGHFERVQGGTLLAEVAGFEHFHRLPLDQSTDRAN